MSNEYLNKTEEQQFEEAKNWFKENGTPILVAIVIACCATFGWNFWKNHQLQIAQKTSENYQAVMESYLQAPEKNQPLLVKFIEDHKASSYATFAQLEQARQAVDKADFATAKIILTDALTSTTDMTLQAVIRFRLAMVDFQLKEYDTALATLAQLKEPAWEQRKHLLRGDIFAIKGDSEQAKQAYKQALALADEQDKLLIEVRLNNL
ncbi:YfgM family protein [[Haemophilus] ducreyi]|uniref:YfgM family protein n=1 Tax=Haemophilus ducreyi TaxID=730 RepID=UPI000655A6C7|nr:tetratricopeptide repeat protein [[Haemophilus] ducreyi]AKO45367.1 hypothetical protein RZ66_03645 [[Haemophilus] ducreyi]AKO46752.1 hypothetical protein RZ67_03530 [[Haemophilus] ducreyi]AKO48092.1 hypothetical protein RZ68_03525 [[Haemophilus] ducreyi]AKO49478.1 hypothetical protein RZ69_03560 [[Haemophilus] ducreyi]ANF61485.1 hypothetical protein A6037_01230 [[Haemophilus] ducreyi]